MRLPIAPPMISAKPVRAMTMAGRGARGEVEHEGDDGEPRSTISPMSPIEANIEKATPVL